ncbi:hypothetical protein BJV74DRAFT_794400 [Russula compacta]|nr:hypothetical protein BJV74DRAFT_794400 [Russula compacta]
MSRTADGISIKGRAKRGGHETAVIPQNPDQRKPTLNLARTDSSWGYRLRAKHETGAGHTVANKAVGRQFFEPIQWLKCFSSRPFRGSWIYEAGTPGGMAYFMEGAELARRYRNSDPVKTYTQTIIASAIRIHHSAATPNALPPKQTLPPPIHSFSC